METIVTHATMSNDPSAELPAVLGAAYAGVSTKKNFVWGLDLSQSMDGAGVIGGLLAVVDEQGSQMAFLYDANGNVGQLVDEWKRSSGVAEVAIMMCA